MPHFVVIAHDGTDPDAPARRQAARPAHFARLPPAVERGLMPFGGAILDEDGRMVGSVFLADFPSRAELDAFLAADPYVVQGVWRRIEVLPVRLAVRDGRITP